MRRHLVRPGLVGHGQVVDGPVRPAPAFLGGQQHDRDARRDVLDHGLRRGAGQYHEPVAPSRDAQHQAAVVPVVAGRDEHRVPAAPGGPLHAPDHLVVPVGGVAVFAVQVGEAQPEHAGAPRGQVPGRPARHVAELGDRGEHFVSGPREHALVPCQHPGHRGRRHPREPRHLVDARFVPHPEASLHVCAYIRAYTIIFRQPVQPKPGGVPVINSL